MLAKSELMGNSLVRVLVAEGLLDANRLRGDHVCGRKQCCTNGLQLGSADSGGGFVHLTIDTKKLHRQMDLRAEEENAMRLVAN